MIRASRQSGSYPRPQLVREQWTDLDGEWQFAYDDDDTGRREHWHDRADLPLRIRVPFAPESRASGIGDHRYHPVVWYRRTFDATKLPGTRQILHFGAVDQEAEVWVDGTHVGTHRGGQTAFRFDITDALTDADEHVIAVRAQDDPHDPEFPRGKQDWREDPHFIWYRRTTGIWKSVWLESVPEVHVAAVSWSTRTDDATVCVDVRLSGGIACTAGAEVEVELWRGATGLARGRATAASGRVRITLEVPAWRNAQERERALWSPESPVLIDASLRVLGPDGVVDEIASYFGLRSVSVSRGQFLLNDHPYYVRGVLEQGYWEDGQLTAPDPGSIRREVELIKELGFNTARIHQKVEDPRFLYWADRLGLLIWGEMASAYSYTPRAAAELVHEWTEAVEQQRNHPSIVVWAPVNESWGVQDMAERADQREFVRAITSLTRALDPTRPVISNDGWEHVDSDLLTIHDYSSEPDVLRSRYGTAEALTDTVDGMGPQGRRLILDPAMRRRLRDLPVVISEFGGLAFTEDGNWGYTTVSDEEDLRARLLGLFDAIRESSVVAGFCYTQLADTLQESNGLLTANREPKLPVDVIRASVLGARSPWPGPTESFGTSEEGVVVGEARRGVAADGFPDRDA